MQSQAYRVNRPLTINFQYMWVLCYDCDSAMNMLYIIYKGYGPIILLDIDVLAQFRIHSRPSSSTLTVIFSWMYLHASLSIDQYIVLRISYGN